MAQIILSDEEIARINRLSEALSKNEYLRQKLLEHPQDVLNEFGLNRIAKSGIFPGGMGAPNVNIIAFAEQSSEGHTDWVPHIDHNDTHTDSHKDDWGPIVISPQ